MWVRKQIDIALVDLVRAGLQAAFVFGQRAAATGETSPTQLRCFSVRTGLDLWLQAVQLPAGSEIIVSSVNIADMAAILRAHRIVPVPVKVEAISQLPELDDVRALVTQRTKGLLFAHLFGNRSDIRSLLEWTKSCGLFFIEDCAQAYCGPRLLGTPGADVSLFSFGPIKTQTALGGAIVCVEDATIRARMRTIEAGYPRQSRWRYLGRVAKYGMLQALMRPWVFALVCRLCEVTGCDLDGLMRRSSRSFGSNLLTAIRRRPSEPLMHMLDRRVRAFDENRLHGRRERGEYLRGRFKGLIDVPGSLCTNRTWWLLPVLCDEPGALVRRLRRAGFDASRAHSLVDFCQTLTGDARDADNWLARTVFLPCYPEMPWSEVRRLADVVLQHMETGREPKCDIDRRERVGCTAS